MNVSDRPSYKLLARMFPGEPERSVPAFDAIAAARLGERFAGLDEIDALILKETEAAWPEDVNVLLKALRSGAPDLVDHFTEQAVVLYFSTPAVSRALTGKPVPLFPNRTVMDDIDYDLLEPVIANCKGLADAERS
ncbi:hypothetical protein [Rhizobium leguminosarum]|nr:hypothetical protein [Rhizobium leguminosarum]